MQVVGLLWPNVDWRLSFVGMAVWFQTTIVSFFSLGVLRFDFGQLFSWLWLSLDCMLPKFASRFKFDMVCPLLWCMLFMFN